MATYDSNEPKRIVRTYSDEVEHRLHPASGAYMLGHVLASQTPDVQRRRDPWRRFFEPQTGSDAARSVPGIDLE